MERAWREHIGRLTLEQLSSADALQAHVRQFEVQLVAQGLDTSIVGGITDVHEQIAKFLSEVPAVDAKTMETLANAQRKVLVGRVMSEIMEKIKETSMEGGTCINDGTLLASNHPDGDFWWLVKTPPKNTRVRTEVKEAVVQRLKQLGYVVMTHTTPAVVKNTHGWNVSVVGIDWKLPQE